MIPIGTQTNITLRGGRRELIFGSQRLVGPGDFTQIARAFDGGAAIVRLGDWTVTPFWTQPVIVEKYSFNKSNSDRQLFGVFGTGSAHILPMNLDLYGLGVNNRGTQFNGTSGREERYTSEETQCHTVSPLSIPSLIMARKQRQQFIWLTFLSCGASRVAEMHKTVEAR